MSGLNVVLFGAGALGRGWSRVISEHSSARLTGFVDPLVGTEKASAWLADYPDIPKATSIDGLVGPFDAAVVTTQSPAHAAAIRTALEHGLHVVVEKPFATTLDDAKSLVELAASRGLTLMVSQNYRFFPGVATLRQAVSEQTFGAIRSVVGQFSYDWAGKPYQHEMEHITALEMSIHHLDLVRAIFAAEAETGLSLEWNPEPSQYQKGGGGQEALYRMRSETGVFPFLYSGNLVGKSPNSEWGGHWRFEFDTATLVVDRIEGRYGLYRARGETYEWIGPFAADIGFGPSFAHFADSVANGKEPWSSGRDNLKSLQMALGPL